MRFVVIALALCAGCVSSSTVSCADGRICPSGKVCDDVHALCVVPAQTTACDGLHDGDVCRGGGVGGLCDRGVCVPSCGDGIQQPGEECDCGDSAAALGAGCAVPNSDTDVSSTCSTSCHLHYCGNGIVDPGEVCDDGVIDDVHCGHQCKSDATCGNGYIDAAKGEECDDGNLQSHDGCSSRCVVEVAGWQVVPNSWVARTQHAAAYHPGRFGIALFGGVTSSGVDGAAWFRDGTKSFVDWTQVPAGGLTARRGAAMATFDNMNALSRKVVLFGGRDANGVYLQDTWQLDANVFDPWTQVVTSAAPGPRVGAAMVNDTTDGLVVLFGGFDGMTAQNDTWVFDGTTWTRVVATGPPARSGHAMAWDADRHKVVLFGGINENGQVFGDTWELDMTMRQWTQIVGAGPPARYATAMAFHPTRHKVVMFGGYATGGTTGGATSDTWEYDATGWTQRTLITQPPPRGDHTLSYDYGGGTDEVVVVGGSDPPGRALDDIWTYDGAWSPRPAKGSPPPAVTPLVFDVAEGVAVYASGSPMFQTWAFDGQSWASRSSAPLPPPRTNAAVAYDAAHQQVVTLGGTVPVGDANTWAWKAGLWSIATNVGQQPLPRLDAGLAFDGADQVLVMFGGTLMADVAETWEYNGNSWLQFTPPLGPLAQHTPAMTYSDALGAIVLYDLDGQTWTYAAHVWSLRPTTSTPTAIPPRTQATLVYDRGRKHVMLFGGRSPLGAALNDLWELDGDIGHLVWTRVAAAGQPPPARYASGMTQLFPYRALVLFGGTTGAGLLGDTWLFQFRSTTPDELCGNGVDDDGDGLVDAADPDCQY